MVLSLMAAFPVRTWHRLPCEASALRLDIVLPAGQSFRWRESSPGEWTSVLAGRVFTLKQDGDDVLYRVFYPAFNQKDSASKKNAEWGFLTVKRPTWSTSRVQAHSIPPPSRSPLPYCIPPSPPPPHLTHTQTLKEPSHRPHRVSLAKT